MITINLKTEIATINASYVCSGNVWCDIEQGMNVEFRDSSSKRASSATVTQRVNVTQRVKKNCEGTHGWVCKPK